jgi:hypothetical protein
MNVGIADDFFNEVDGDVVLDELVAVGISEVTSSVAYGNPPVTVDLVPNKAVAIGARVVAKSSAEERSLVVVGVVKADMVATLLVAVSHNAPTLHGADESFNY